MDTNRAAQTLGVARQTLAKWRWEGRGPAFFKAGAKVLYDPSDLAAWLEGQRRQAGESGATA